ncbi:MAG: complex I NDUFA9 subunit family protein [Paracoccus sp. (in: a-proteobacteria)]|uniref:complex I NDUFA9 subunit family protein n=1 Tax=Paracoccus sp. TaxID=267 RepID=UPI0026DF9A71|nr:complex I NDUFA9 subunit family protein [Paracoccus sp. (in: a-proteobacteria)]MDO5614045.1 complex I NDUFA9 subunit family protein [Paracoccus sp. (in: a-proteobacteria)]
MSKLVTIYGGSGFVGRQIARILAKQGWRIRIAVRRPDEALFVRGYGAVGQVVPVLCNIRDDESVRAAMADADAVVNCVGILVREGKNDFEPVQHDGAARVARISAEMGVPVMVHLSAIGADPDAASHYAASKGKGEAAVRQHRPDAIILRPSAIFGEGDGLYTKFARKTKIFPLILPIAGAATRMQPVYVGDVAKAAAKAVNGQAQPGIYELGGPDILTVDDIVRQALHSARRRRGLFKMPFWFAGIAGGALDLVQTLTGGLVTNRVMTRDFVRLMRHDNVVSEGARTLADLGIEPVAAEAVIDSYLWPFRPSGQYDEIKESAQNLRHG